MSFHHDLRNVHYLEGEDEKASIEGCDRALTEGQPAYCAFCMRVPCRREQFVQALL